MYYFDHSATTPLLPEVTKLMNDINKEAFGNPSSIYSLGRKSRNIIETARNQVAKSISARPNQIIFTSGGTESNNQVFWSLINGGRKHVVSNVIEHPAVLKVLQNLSSIGLEHDLVSVDDCQIIGEWFESVSTLGSAIRQGLGQLEVSA